MNNAGSLVLGREGKIALRYLLISIGIALTVVALKFVGNTVGGPEALLTSVWALVLLLIVVLVLGAAHAKQNEGLLVSVLIAFLPAFAEREFDIVFGIGQPNPGILYGAGLALVFAIPVGVVAFVIGRRI